MDGSPPADKLAMPRAEKRDVPDDAYLDGRISKAAVQKLREVKDEPFFLAVGFWKPHLPFNAPAKYWDRYQRSEIKLPVNPHPPAKAPTIALHDGRELMRDFKSGLTAGQVQALRHGYYAAISYVDAQIGRILDELDRLKLREKTIVVFWSDHGFHLGEHALWCKNSNFELDAHVPLMISVPGQPTAGKQTRSLVELLDVYPTLADVCNLQAPAEIEGHSLRPLIENTQQKTRRFALTQNPRPPYRPKGVPPEQMGYSIRSDSFRYTEWREYDTGAVIARELYDHENDPAETRNIVDRNDMQKVVQQHAEMMNR